MHRLHRVRFFVARRHETPDGDEYSYSERVVLTEVTPATLEACRLDLQDRVKASHGIVFPPEVLWHSHFRRRRRRYHPPRRLWQQQRRQKERARRRRDLMLRDKQRILDRCSTTERN